MGGSARYIAVAILWGKRWWLRLELKMRKLAVMWLQIMLAGRQQDNIKLGPKLTNRERVTHLHEATRELKQAQISVVDREID